MPSSELGWGLASTPELSGPLLAPCLLICVWEEGPHCLARLGQSIFLGGHEELLYYSLQDYKTPPADLCLFCKCDRS